MSDFLTIAGSLAGLAKTGAEIASTNEATKRNALLIEFQQAIIQANRLTAEEQVRNSSLLAHNQELEKEIARLNDWSIVAERHQLTEVAVGVFAQVEKNFVGKLQSAHKFCATCFSKGNKSPLQLEHVEVGRQLSLTCHLCNSKVIFRCFIDRL